MKIPGENIYDVIVVGLGVFGASSAKALSNKGYKVLGLDANRPGDDNTLSFGQTRIFRQIYTEDESFISKTFQARSLFSELEKASGLQILKTTGLLSVFSRDRQKEYSAAVDVAERYKIAHRKENRDDHTGLIEENAAIIDVEAYYRAIAMTVNDKNATFNYGEKVVEIIEEKGHTKVLTDKAVYRGRKVILTAGQWSKGLLQELNANLAKRLKFERSPVLFFESSKEKPLKQPLSVFNREGYFFAIPNFYSNEIKVFNYFPTSQFDSMDSHRSEVKPAETLLIEKFARQYLDLNKEKITKTHMGLYNTTSDERFILQWAREDSHVFVASGGSGHAFKFAPLLGQEISSLVQRVL